MNARLLRSQVFLALALSSACAGPAGGPAQPRPGSPVVRPAATPSPTALPRSTVDRPDDGPPYMVHAVYAVPAGAEDEGLDTNGHIEGSIAAMQSWFAGQADGRTLRFDRYQGHPDITYVALPQTDAELTNNGDLATFAVQLALARAGFDDPRKVYLCYYEGGTGVDSHVLGAANFGGAVVFLRNAFPGLSNGKVMTAQDIVALHESLHALGAVPICAPHLTDPAKENPYHTHDAPQDIMAAGQESGASGDDLQLDPGHDDYYGTGRADCLDLARSLFLDPTPASPQVVLGRPLEREPGPAIATLPPDTIEDEKGARLLAYSNLKLSDGPARSLTLSLDVTFAPQLKTRVAVLHAGDDRPEAIRVVGSDGHASLLMTLPPHGKFAPFVFAYPNVPNDDQGTTIDLGIEIDADHHTITQTGGAP